MSVTFSILPVDAQLAAWLDTTYGISCPLGNEASRYPTLAEVRGVLDSLEGYTVEYHVDEIGQQVHVYHTATSSPPTAMPRTFSADHATIQGTFGDDGIPTHVYFRGGNDALNVRILERLSRHCGPLVMVADWGGPPVLVTPGMDPTWVVEDWRARIAAEAVRIELRSLRSPDLPGLEDGQIPADPECFHIRIQAFVARVGEDTPIEDEGFTFLLCTPRWLEREVHEAGYALGLHHIVVPRFDYRRIWRIIAALCEHVDGPDWQWVAGELGRYGERDWDPVARPQLQFTDG